VGSEEGFGWGFDWNSRKEAGDDAEEEEEEGGMTVGAEREVGEKIEAGRGSERMWLCTAIIWRGFSRVREEGSAASAPCHAGHVIQEPTCKATPATMAAISPAARVHLFAGFFALLCISSPSKFSAVEARFQGHGKQGSGGGASGPPRSR
jgi:hypothetical protein